VKGWVVIVVGFLIGPAAALLSFAVQMSGTLRWKELSSRWGDGAIIRSLDGELDRLGPDGRMTTLLPAQTRGFADLLDNPYLSSSSLLVDGERLWVLRSAGPGRDELWSGVPGGPFERTHEFAANYPVLLGGKSVVVTDYRGGEQYEASVAVGRPLVWRRSGRWFDNSVERTVDGLRYSVDSMRQPASVVLDGKAGRIKVWNAGSDWFFVLRVTPDAMWILLSGRQLARVERAKGKIVARWPLPGESPGDGRRWVATPAGVFVRSVDGFWLVDWDGRAKRLSR
jgi:hypothetical protein